MSTSVLTTDGRTDERGSQLAVGVLATAYVALAVCYLAPALLIDRDLTLWMDEVLAVWAARLPNYSAVIDAIWHGSEFSPPTYDLILHALFEIFGYSPMVARLPSTLAVLLVAGALARIAARRLDPRLGPFAFGMILNSRLFDYAIQARPYALLIALQTAALLVWIEWPVRYAGWWRPVAIAILLAAAASLHVYGLVGTLAFLVMEGLWSLRTRRLRGAIWLALAVGTLATVAWLPLIRHLAQFNRGDTSAPDFYAKPDLAALRDAIGGLSIPPGVLIVLAAVSAASVALARLQHEPRPALRWRPDPDVVVAAIGCLAVLPIAFLASVLVTHAFSVRYALTAVIGAVLLVATLLDRHGPWRRVPLVMVPVLCVALVGRVTFGDQTKDALALVAATPGDGPIVVGEGLMFLQLMDVAPPIVRSRLVFLTTPPGEASRDPTNEHQILRLRFIRPSLPVKSSLAFFADHPAFSELVRSRSTVDSIAYWVDARHWPSEVQVRTPVGVIDKVRVPRSDADPS